jgi:adenosylcobinamide-phosphate synthase
MRSVVKVLWIAIVIDWLLGEPSNQRHPVAYMGRLIALLRRHAPQSGNDSQFLYGAWITILGSGIVYLIGYTVFRLTDKLPYPFQLLVRGWILKTTFSWQGLDRAAHEVEVALRAGDIEEARRLLSWHLVSRDVSQLNEHQMSAAVIESVAENTSDGVIAPLVWYAVGDIPLALVYRYINTGDAMLGYRDIEREWLGKFFARTDDLLNLIPARLTAFLFIIVRPQAWSIWQRDANKTSSPNAGHPMSAMAGALDIELEKVDHYTLNQGGALPTVQHISQARRVMMLACGIFALGLGVMLRQKHD